MSKFVLMSYLIFNKLTVWMFLKFVRHVYDVNTIFNLFTNVAGDTILKF